MKLPRVRFINYRKLFPQASIGCWAKWFDVQRFWGGKIILIHVKAFAIELDFRRNWIADMMTGTIDGKRKD